jgi:hypothetical protein
MSGQPDGQPQFPIAASIGLFAETMERATGEVPRTVSLPRATYDALVEEAKDFCNIRTASTIMGEDPTHIRICGVLCVIAEGE